MASSSQVGHLSSGTLSLDRCKLNPQGIESVLSHLRSHTLFADVPIPQLRAMAIAFLVHGGIDDGNHALPRGGLHTAHIETHKTGQTSWRMSMRPDYIQLVMDVVCLRPAYVAFALIHTLTS